MTKRSVSESALLVAAPDVLSTAFGDEIVLLNLRDGVYYGLEDVGARIWTILRHPVSVQVICDAIAAEYDVERNRCARDVRAIIADLADRGLISVRGDR